MSSFFFGWRRKAGCLTLLLTCLVVFLWVRSHMVHEIVRIYDSNDSGGPFTYVGSMRGVIFYTRAVQVFGERKPMYEQRPPTDNLQLTGTTIPYWGIALPLAVLSVCLLFFNLEKPDEPGNLLPYVPSKEPPKARPKKEQKSRRRKK